MGAVPVERFQEWESLAESLGLGVLAESHHAEELQQALTLKTTLIGVNNRDLTRFTTSIETTLGLQKLVPADRILVTESGIGDPAIVATMVAAGISAFLVGGALMSSAEPGAALAALFADRL
jgi:indole-3-glycerol phosphate synthase